MAFAVNLYDESGIRGFNLRRAFQMGRESLMPLFTRPVSAVFLALAVLIVVFSVVSQMKKNKLASEE